MRAAWAIPALTMTLLAGVVGSTVTAHAADVADPVVRELTVNGQPVALGSTDVAQYAGVDATGPVRIRIGTSRAVTSVTIRPSVLGIQAMPAADGTIEFRLDHPAYLSVEFNDNVESIRPLFLFVDPPEVNPPTPNDPAVRYLGPGVHTGTIALRSGQTLYLARGAVLKGRVEVVGTSSTGVRKGVRILGRGVIDSADLDPDNQKPIRIRNADDVTVDGPTVVNRDGWSVVVASAEHVQLRNVKVISWNRLADGIDILASQHVDISRVFVRSGDDSIAIKNGKPDFLASTTTLRTSPN